MRIRKEQRGFAAPELILAVVIVAAIVVAGWWVYQQRANKTTAAPTTTSATSEAQSPVAHNVSTAPPVNSTSDLDKALTTLSQNDPSAANSADSSTLSSQASF